MPLETYTGWSVMRQHDVHIAYVRKPFNLVGRVVSLGVTLEPVRAPLVIRQMRKAFAQRRRRHYPG
jgi:hypothetical protein